jgi:hypothetical protein
MGGNKLKIVCLLCAVFLLRAAFAEDKPLSGLNVQDFDDKTEKKTDWGNNPFVVPLNDVAISELKLSGIVYSQDMKGAIVGNQIVMIGDKIGSNEVVAIEKNKVVLRNENGLYSLAISGGGQ